MFTTQFFATLLFITTISMSAMTICPYLRKKRYFIGLVLLANLGNEVFSFIADFDSHFPLKSSIATLYLLFALLQISYDVKEN